MKANKKSINLNHASFSSLTEIVEHFRSVPYKQFQQELQAWFQQGLQAQGHDLEALVLEGHPNIPQLVSQIYHWAEIQQTLSENHIAPSHDDY